MKAYYCYTDEDEKIIVNEEPEDFKKLSYSKVIMAPNLGIAEMVYATKLRIMKFKGEDINE